MRTKRFGGLAIAAAALALLAACSSSKNNGSASAPTAAANPSGGGASASSAAMVKTTSGSLGTFLTDGAGRTLYLWVADKAGPSTCYDACAHAWPPLITTGAPTAGSGVDASKLGTTDRKDGAKQVTYNGNPLYYYFGDSKAGDTTGQGSDGFGAKWWVVTPSGTAITGSGAGTTSSSSNGYTY